MWKLFCLQWEDNLVYSVRYGKVLNDDKSAFFPSCTSCGQCVTTCLFSSVWWITMSTLGSYVWSLFLKLLISLTQPTFYLWRFGLCQRPSSKFIRRSIINSCSGSCYDSDARWQEIGRTCGSACSCPRPGSRIPPFEYVLTLWSI